MVVERFMASGSSSRRFVPTRLYIALAGIGIPVVEFFSHQPGKGAAPTPSNGASS
jgi:hypothetical protein